MVQQRFCRERRLAFVPSPGTAKSGFAMSTEGLTPINGLRHPVTGETTGWYIWCGEELSTEPDFFAAIHTSHLYGMYPQLTKLLGMAPGHRFLLADDYLDVWYDPSILNV